MLLARRQADACDLLNQPPAASKTSVSQPTYSDLTTER